MTSANQQPYFKDPSFRQILQAIQEESWQEGLSKLDALLEKYPFEPEIRNFRQQVLVKSRIDAYEAEEIEVSRRKLARRRIRTFGIIALVILGIIFASSTYAGVLRGVADRQFRDLRANFEDIELSIKFRNGQNLLTAGRAEEALVIFEEIKAENPDFENIDVFIAEAKGVLTIDGQYDQAVGLIAQEEYDQALVILKDILDKDPSYKDVQIRISEVERYINLGALLEEANLAFDSANWSLAIIQYEAIRLADSNYETDFVEERLFNSYVNGASTVIDNPSAELEELKVAEGYFRRALSLRPQDDAVFRIRKRVQDTIRQRLVDRYISLAQAALVNQEDSVQALEVARAYLNAARDLDPANNQIALQSELANRYLEALSAFRSLLWNQVISNLEYIYSFEPEYASGTARQTLYDSFILRGDTYLSSGEFELGLSDFRQAIDLAEDMGSTGQLSVCEAQLKVAFSLGLLFDYEGAVIMYQQAVDTCDFRNRLATSDPAFITSLNQATALAQNAISQGEDFRIPYIRFRDLFEQNELVYSEFVTHIVEEGEYLSQIANQYRSSIQAIVKANDISDPNRIVAGEELIIPIFSNQ